MIVKKKWELKFTLNILNYQHSMTNKKYTRMILSLSSGRSSLTIETTYHTESVDLFFLLEVVKF